MPAIKAAKKAAVPAEKLSLKNIAKHKAPYSINLTKNACGNISEYPIEFTKDSKYFFSSVGSCVKIYSVATGAVVKVLSQSPSLGGHLDTITRVILNPKNHLQLYTASLDGTIKLWDYNDDILLKTYDIKAPIQSMEICQRTPEYAYLIVKKTDKDGKDIASNNTAVYRFMFGSSDQDSGLRRIHTLTDCRSIDISSDGKWLAFAARFKVYIWPVVLEEDMVMEDDNDKADVIEAQLRQHAFVDMTTVLKFHPFKPILAVGDESGKITHITNFTSENEKDYIRSIHHWHHMPVDCLKFMEDGSYLMSGGQEAVIVIWQLDTGHKQFLPRMGGGVTSITISPNHRYYCVGLKDNSIRLINSISQTIEQVIQGLQYAKAESNMNPLSTGLIIEPRNRHVVLNGVQGSLQFYNAIADSHVMDLEVVPMNRIVRSGEREIIHAHVAHVAFLRSGEWMATVDMRDDKITTPELFLKFWQWDPDTQSYKLHTRVDYPHTKPITSLIFNPTSHYRHSKGLMAITTSEDKTFKVWNLSQSGSNNQAAWVCRSVGVYRDDTPTTATFSEDGSILAVAFGQATTIWDPYSNSIQAVFAQPNSEIVEKLAFLGDNCPFLIAISKEHLHVWNILTCNVWWSYKMTVDHFSVNKDSNQFAVVQNHPSSRHTTNIKKNDDNGLKSRIVVFDPKSSVPLALYHSNYTCRGIAWLPNKVQQQHDGDEVFHSSSTLICLTNTYELILHSVKPSTTTESAGQQTENAMVSTTPADLQNSTITTEKSLFNDMYGKRENERETDEQTRIRLKQAQALREEAMTVNYSSRKGKTSSSIHRNGEVEDETGLSAPSHVLPGVESLFDTFMTSIMALRIENDEEKTSSSVDAMDVDVNGIEGEAEENQNTSTEDQHLVGDTILGFAAEDLPTLTEFFANGLARKPVVEKVQSDSSSDDDDSDDEEDPSNIDW
ncbi:hypothetical protein BDF20DRAFT_912490 [Mycotypha africana]|uniref:uncharacterized protein n=1 Tax=Mycotypha africana TaxID=64632 RepID=UPI0023002E08|nr:uncharacterized protein BDF20DRAFT_912490 [Mycotypha africana]KAI8982312.1 hypothetical protein BDF20DRAFT_912490 [Mycotypha africana]